MKPIPTERQEQSALIDWWDSFAPSKGINPELLYAVPNGAVLAGDAGARSRQVNALKSQGMRPGAPDLVLDVPRNGYHGLRIELKRADWTKPRNQHERDQRIYLDALIQQGYSARFCAGATAAMRMIKEYLG